MNVCAHLPVTFAMLICSSLMTSAMAVEGVVQLEKESDRVVVTIDGKPFTTYNTAVENRKPFLLPVHAPDGTVINRPVDGAPEDTDHKHHRGIWLAVDQVNGIKFWNEGGTIRNVLARSEVAAGNPAKLLVENHWLNSDGSPLVKEETEIQFFANRTIVYHINFSAVDEDVTFGDTKEGLFAFRMATNMKEKNTGTVINADGLKGTKQCWGKSSNWVDYFGKVDGKAVGIAIFDHPDNFRPSRYHVRNYGLFAINPFGESAYTGKKNPPKPVTLTKGREPLKLTYGMYLHMGDTETGKVAEAYETFLKNTR